MSNITFDGCAANFSMCKLFSCDFNKSKVKADLMLENNKHFLFPDLVQCTYDQISQKLLW